MVELLVMHFLNVYVLDSAQDMHFCLCSQKCQNSTATDTCNPCIETTAIRTSLLKYMGTPINKRWCQYANLPHEFLLALVIAMTTGVPNLQEIVM